MENFVKTSFELANGAMVVNTTKGAIPARGLVMYNDKGVMYLVVAKVRNTDKYTMVKALAKAILAEKRENLLENSHECVQQSKNKRGLRLTGALSCHCIMPTDKNGKFLTDSALNVREASNNPNSKLSDVIKFNKTMPIYKLVVEQGLDWADERVVQALDAWVKAAIIHLDYDKRLDDALERAADSTEKEDKAAEKAAKKEDKAAA